MLESLKNGVDLIGCQRHIPPEEAVVWRSGKGYTTKIYSKPIVNPTYTEQRLGPRDYSLDANQKPSSICGYCPRILRRQSLETQKDYFYYPTGGKNLRLLHVICSQILSWLEQDCVRLLGNFGDTNIDVLAVLPWIVEPKKPRCCIDGSPFTCCAPRPKPKCHLDTAADLLKIISKNDYFSVIDDQSGFLQARINEISQQLCRLQFGELLLTHRGLAFGIHVSPPKFQNLNRVAVSTMNRIGFPTLLYLDDRLVLEKLLRKLRESETGIGVYNLLCLLVCFGGYISSTKCQFFPEQRGRFLGFDFDTVAETVTVPAEKHAKVAAQIDKLLEKVILSNGEEYLDMHELECIRGRIISWCLVVHNFGFYTREMNAAIAAHYARFKGPRATDCLMKISDIDGYDYLVEELLVWKELKYVKLSRKWVLETHDYLGTPMEIYTDASGGGIGSARYIGADLVERKHTLPLWLSPLPIHCKEAYAILIAIQAEGELYFHKRLICWCDNRSVVDAWCGRGSRDLPLARILRQLCDFCHDHGIILTLKWIETEKQLADRPSRELTPIFARLKERVSERLVHYLGVNLDLFASPSDNICSRYFSQYPYPGCTGVDGMSYQPKAADVVYAYPPRVLMLPFLKVRDIIIFKCFIEQLNRFQLSLLISYAFET